MPRRDTSPLSAFGIEDDPAAVEALALKLAIQYGADPAKMPGLDAAAVARVKEKTPRPLLAGFGSVGPWLPYLAVGGLALWWFYRRR